MLNEKEKTCVTEFLEDFPSVDLFAVALLVSRRNLQPNSRDDALDIICQHIDCLESLLEKKKISKQYISQYLHKHKVSITFSWDKAALIRKLLEYWKSEGRLSSSGNALQPNSMSTYYNQLTIQFSEWFYSLINDQHLSNLGPQHFFVDTKMKISLQSENGSDVIEANNAVDVVQALREMQSKYRLTFLPNLSPDAIKYETNIYGQIMYVVGGTLHSFNVSQVVGLFEQMFLLLRDVSDNENWKIKTSQIILKHKSDSNILPIC